LSTPRFAIGIDLGTTNTAVARLDLEAPEARTEVVAVPQLVSSVELVEAPLLPSFLYVPAQGAGPLPLPWDAERRFAVGSYARQRAAEAPGRVVASAKSWLCHPSADRRAGLLPLGAPDDVERISPVEASWRYLEHVVEAYDQRHAADGGPLAAQEVVLTVPASFDAAARELTVEAALAAGIERLTLLEEPQAALYAWLESAGDGWRALLRPGEVVLCVDVGGGTSDFTAVEARAGEGGALELARIAVGDHILCGGDNMDLALAHLCRDKLERGGAAPLDGWQMAALAHACRGAKERLLGGKREKAAVAVPSRGAKLVGGTLRTELARSELMGVLLDGFLPWCDAAARPAARPRAGLRELGLPYASDAAITRHLTAFLARHAESGGARGRRLLCPAALLVNGGVMAAAPLRERLCAVVARLAEGEGVAAPRLLEASDLALAVARGAAYYGRVRRGKGIRIRGGTARAYYVGVEAAAPAVPGVEPPVELVCLAPFGMEEGTSAALPSTEVAVVVGEPVRFRFFGSSVRRSDVAGARLARWSKDEIDELAPIELTLPPEGRSEGDLVPVRLGATVTEVGTLLLEAVPCAARAPDERWKIELSVRAR
jgi:hypothetical protein